MTPVAGIAFVLLALGVLIPGVKALRTRGAIEPETARKLVHLGMGMVCLFLPGAGAGAGAGAGHCRSLSRGVRLARDGAGAGLMDSRSHRGVL